MTFETATTRDLDLADLVGRALGPAAAGRVFAEAPADREVIPAARFLEPDALRTAILRAAGGAGIDDDALDLRPSAARWTRQYAAAILPAILAPLAAGVALDASIERCTIVMNGHLPGGLHLDDPAGGALFWPERVGAVWEHGRLAASLDDLRAHAFRTLFTQHLVPLFDQVLAQAKLSSDVLWSNVAEHATLIYDSARSHLTPPPQALDEDDALLMKGASLPGLAGPNPLRGWIVREPVDQPDFPQPLLLRRVCSLHYLLPDRIGRFCSDCPLISKEERIAQARIARGAPSGAASATLTRGPAVATSAGMPGVGEPAPDLALPATGGRQISLSDYRNQQAVVLFFYVADDGAACTAEALSFRKRYADLEARGVEVLGVSIDSVASHEQFSAKYGLPYPLLADVDHTAAQRYGVWQRTKLGSRQIESVVRTTFVVNRDGTIRAVFADVRGGDHADHILALFE